MEILVFYGDFWRRKTNPIQSQSPTFGRILEGSDGQMANRKPMPAKVGIEIRKSDGFPPVPDLRYGLLHLT
jgi:hypothetical protein